MQDSQAGAAADAQTGTLVGGRYRIVDLIGRGGMAAVYRATDETLGRPVALKLFAADGSETSELERETSEIRLLASLNHHALVTLFDANVAVVGNNEQAYLVMELVEGPTLRARIDEGPISPGDIAHMTVDLAEALHVVHARLVVHRDIKPANILLATTISAERGFRVKLADFGIAYLADSTRLTTPGTLIGTAAYVSPEQAQGATPGPPSDIYSLGLVLLEALTGQRAFPGSMIESLSARLMRAPQIPDELGPQWKSLLTRMTAMDAADRPSALEVASAARPLSTPGSTIRMAAPAATELMDLDPDGDAPTARMTTISPAAPSAASPASQATVAFAAAPAADAAETVVFATPVTHSPAAQAASQRAQPAANRTAAPAKKRSGAGRAVFLTILVLVLLAVIAVGAWWVLTQQGAAVPAIPAIDGPLGEHLEDLMESVTP